MRHELKCLIWYFDLIKKGKKTFEVRYNDRNFKEKDVLLLREYNQIENYYTGNSLECEVLYILDDNRFCKDNFVIMSIKVLE